MNDPLAKHDLRRLEQASAELNNHIRERRRHFRPSTPRRLIGLCLSVPGFVIGSAVLFWGVTTSHFLGLHMLFGIGLMIGSAAWIYSDWFE